MGRGENEDEDISGLQTHKDTILKDWSSLCFVGLREMKGSFHRCHHRPIGPARVEIDRRQVDCRAAVFLPLSGPWQTDRQTRGCRGGGTPVCRKQARQGSVRSGLGSGWFQIAAAACCCFQGCCCCFTASCRWRRGKFSDRGGCVEMLTIGEGGRWVVVVLGGGRPLKRLKGSWRRLWRHLEKSRFIQAEGNIF